MSEELNLRGLIRGIGAIGTIGAVGGTGLILGSQSARATANGDVDDPEVFTSDDGTVDTRVILTSTYQLYGPTGSELTGSSGYPDRPSSYLNFVVSVDNEEATTEFGNEDATGDSDNSADVGIGNE